MRPKSAMFYLNSLQDISKEFVEYVKRERDSDGIKGNFLDDMHRLGFESISFVALDTKMGSLKPQVGMMK